MVLRRLTRENQQRLEDRANVYQAMFRDLIREKEPAAAARLGDKAVDARARLLTRFIPLTGPVRAKDQRPYPFKLGEKVVFEFG